MNKRPSGHWHWLLGVLLAGVVQLAGPLWGNVARAQSPGPTPGAASDQADPPGAAQREANKRAMESALDQLKPQPDASQSAQGTQMTPVRPGPKAQPPAWIGKDGKACCTPGEDCPCTPGVNCACTPGVNCACTPGKNCPCTPGKDCPAKPPQRSDFCTPGKDCPCQGEACLRCTPGLNCACTPFVNCPDDKGLLFERDSAELSADTKAKLARVVEEFNRHTAQKYRIEGHASDDEQGKVPRAQVTLSVRRANAVKQALLEGGLAPERIDSSLGWGSTCRLTLAPADGRNRRVQFVESVDKTLCSSAEGKIRLPVPPPKKGGAKPAAKPGAKPGAAAQKPAGAKPPTK